MAAVGINVLVNFMIVNVDKLENTFNFVFFGLHELAGSYQTFAFAAVIEEIVLIIFTTFYFISKKNEFTGNIKYALITQTSQTFDPIPLFNFIKSNVPRVRQYAQESLILMFERIPFKSEIDINQSKFRNSLMDGICDPNPNSSTTCYKILVQLEKDVPNTVLPWIIEALESPNYDKSIPIAKSLLNADINLVESIPENIIFNLIEDKEWRTKLLGLKILSRLIDKNNELILNLNIDKLVNDPDSKVQIETLNILAKSSIVLPAEIIIELINNSNKEIRAAGIKNIKNLDINRITPQIISKIMPLMKDTNATVRASIFEVFAKVGHFQKFFIPILPFLDGLTDLNEKVRIASIEALEKYFDEQPGSLDIDVIISKIDPNNNAVLNSVLTLLGRLWEKNPEKILMTLLIFIKFENQELKQNISNILVEKYETNPDLITQNIINIEDVAGFVTKGIISSTLIKIAKKDPNKIIPKLISYLESTDDNIKLNAIVSLEGLIDEFKEIIQIKPFLTILQKDDNKKIKKEASKVISKIAKTHPKAIKPVMAIILQSLNEQESSVKIVLSKSLLEISKESPEIIPIRPIVGFLSDQESFIRETGAKILGQIGTDKVAAEVADALINKGLVDDEWIVREAAVSSLGNVIEHLDDIQLIIPKLVALLDDEQAWVRRSAMNMISNIEGIKASQIPFSKVESNLSSSDAKVREASAGLLKIYGYTNIDRVFDKILLLLDDEDEDVRKNMIKTMVDIIQEVGLEKTLSNLLMQLSDKGNMELQRSIAKIFSKTVQYEDEKIKKRVIALLKIRCEMSQDPIICEILHKLREG
jgi:HEAT repeat protein